MCYSTEMNENGHGDKSGNKKKKKSKSKLDRTINSSFLSKKNPDDQIEEIDSSSATCTDAGQRTISIEGKSKKKKKHSDKTNEKQGSQEYNGEEIKQRAKSLRSEVALDSTSSTNGAENVSLTRIKEKTDSDSQKTPTLHSETEQEKKKKEEKYKSGKGLSDIRDKKTSHSLLSVSSLTSSPSSSPSSSKTDFDFFKGVLSTIPPSALASYEIPESESDQEEGPEENSGRKRKRKDHDKKAAKKQRLNAQSGQSSQTKPHDGKEEEPYSKAKEKQKHKHKNKNTKTKKLVKESELAKAADRMQMLQQKLEARIKELHAKKGKLSPEELVERKRLKRKESKMKLKIRRKAEKLGKTSENATSKNDNADKVTVATATSSKPSLVDKGGKLVFSKFDFSDSGKGEKKKSKSGLVGKDYKRLLEKIEKRNEKMNSLKETDAEKAKKVEQKTIWKTAMLKAEGERVKDDVKLLKKSLKIKEKQKIKRKKKWKERESQVKKRQEQRQEKRQKHIQERKQAGVDKKMKKAKKKGRLLPGF